jgi:galactitol PTS system EIIC component
MASLQDFLTTFFGYKAYVMLPIIMFVLALAARLPLLQAVRSTVALAAGFAGVFIAFNFFVANISPAVQALSLARGLSFPALDVGWLPLAAITWASPLAAISIPLVLGLNLLMLAVGWTRAIYIDIWNYWHFALMGALAMTLFDNWWAGLSATLLLAVYCFKMTEWNAPDVERETGLAGIAISPVSVNGTLPFVVFVDWLMDRIPGLRHWNYNPERQPPASADQPLRHWLALLGEPMVIGLLMGLLLGWAADYTLQITLEMGVNIAAVMFLLPKSAGLIGDAMIPITTALRERVEQRFPNRTNLVVAMDTGFLMQHKSVITTGLILMGLAIAIALVLPGNQVLPLGDLSNLISIMSLSVLIFRGNVVRAVLAGIPVIVAFLLISSDMAHLYTDLAGKTPSFDTTGLGTITSFTDGGNPPRYVLYALYQGKLWAVLALAFTAGGMVMARKRYQRAMQKPLPETPQQPQ